MATDLWYDADLRLRFGVVPLGTIALKPVQEILQPRKQPFNLPTSAIPSQAAQSWVVFFRFMRCEVISSIPYRRNSLSNLSES